jgi:hypothetical protein
MKTLSVFTSNLSGGTIIPDRRSFDERKTTLRPLLP